MQQSPCKLLVFRWLLAAWFGIAWSTAASADAEVLNVRLGVYPDRTRVVLDLSAATGYRIEPQADPRRLVIVLDQAGFKLPAGGSPAGGGLIRAIRIEPAGSRIVLDLTAPSRVTQSQLLQASDSAPARIFFDLRAGGAEAQAMAIVPVKEAEPVDEPDPPKPTSVATMPVQLASTEAVAIPAGAGRTLSVGPKSAASSGQFPIPPRKPADEEGYTDAQSNTLVAALDSAAVLPQQKAAIGGGDLPVIVIDAGHGGKDSGAVGAKGTMEKDVNLKMAKELKALLEATGRYKVVLTRTDDHLLALRRRIEVARDAQADLFISLHADHNDKTSLRGASVYTLSENASDAEAAAAAARENKEDLIAGVDLSSQGAMVTSILIDLAQRETKNLSARFAGLLTDELSEHTLVLRDSHRFAGFVVLKALDVPSVLIELGYLSNAQDEAALGSKRHRRMMGNAIRDAIDHFFAWQQTVRRS